MATGKRSGDRSCGPRVLSVSLFVEDDGGYTTVAMAVALLVSLTLVFSAASAEWAMARSAEVQEVADAAALAGSNCVAAFSTVYQVLDACVLSLGLSGVMVMGAGSRDPRGWTAAAHCAQRLRHLGGHGPLATREGATGAHHGKLRLVCLGQLSGWLGVRWLCGAVPADV